VKHFRRRGQLVEFPRPDDSVIAASEGERTGRISSIYASLTHWLGERLEEIPEEDAEGALAEIEAQAVVIGGVGRYLLDSVPPGSHTWVDANATGFARWLRKKQKK
jgi:hypothetical protein